MWNMKNIITFSFTVIVEVTSSDIRDDIIKKFLLCLNPIYMRGMLVQKLHTISIGYNSYIRGNSAAMNPHIII